MKNTRITNQRIKIMQYLKSVKTHPTAEMVYEAVSKELPAKTLATVYRNLNLLARQGKILRFEANKEYRYDGDTSQHQHFVCEKCERIVDVFSKKLSTDLERVFKKHLKPSNFSLNKAVVLMYGLCSECNRHSKRAARTRRLTTLPSQP